MQISQIQFQNYIFQRVTNWQEISSLILKMFFLHIKLQNQLCFQYFTMKAQNVLCDSHKASGR